MNTDDIIIKNKELEDRNNLLIKITGDIENIYEDRERLQEENDKLTNTIKDLQDKIQSI